MTSWLRARLRSLGVASLDAVVLGIMLAFSAPETMEHCCSSIDSSSAPVMVMTMRGRGEEQRALHRRDVGDREHLRPAKAPATAKAEYVLASSLAEFTRRGGGADARSGRSSIVVCRGR
jgi:hypothetical protein